jgi:hypothetical protein
MHQERGALSIAAAATATTQWWLMQWTVLPIGVQLVLQWNVGYTP